MILRTMEDVIADEKQRALARKAWLDGLKPGDRVAVEYRGHASTSYRIDTVEHVTPKRTRFDLVNTSGGFGATGEDRIQGNYRTTSYYIVPITDDVRNEIGFAMDFRRVIDTDWKKCSRETVRRVAQLVRDDEKKAGQ